jgi:hypothetical protein
MHVVRGDKFYMDSLVPPPNGEGQNHKDKKKYNMKILDSLSPPPFSQLPKGVQKVR